MEYSCYHLLNFDENLSLKHLKNVETSEVRNKVEELVEVLVDTRGGRVKLFRLKQVIFKSET